MFRAGAVLLFVVAAFGGGSAWADAPAKKRVLIVSSYHPEYLWSQDTSAGVNAAFLEAGWLDDEEQARRFLATDRVEGSRVMLRKLWMDTKRANSNPAVAGAVARVLAEVAAFRPDVVLLGDDNAANYVGGNLLDTRTPVVFWGVNGNPRKYGIIDSMARPGHNVTGVYQAGYLLEGVQWLRKLLPEVKRLAVLSDASPTARAKVKQIERLERAGNLGVTLVGAVVTDSYARWKQGALDLDRVADAFLVLNHNTLKDGDGRAVPQLEAGAWYLHNVRKPDLGHERQFVVEGVLCAVDDSGFLQGYEAARIATRILDEGADPATIPVTAPPRGKFVVNLARARMLGLHDRVAGNDLVEDSVTDILAVLQR